MGFSSKVRRGTSKKRFPVKASMKKSLKKLAGKAKPPVRGGKKRIY